MEKDLIFAIQSILSQTPQKEELIDSCEAIKILGISKSTLYKYNLRKEIPYFRPKNSKKIYYLRKDLLGFMSQIRVASKHEIAEQAKNIIGKN